MTTTGSSLEERVSHLEGGYEHVATKADLAGLRTELKTDIAELRAELKTDIAKLRTDIAELRVDVAESQNRQTRWMVGMMLSGMAIISAVVFGIAQLIK